MYFYETQHFNKIFAVFRKIDSVNIDLEQFKYVGELEITNDIENQSVIVYNCINREPQENVVTNGDDNAIESTSNEPKDGSSNDNSYEGETDSPNAYQNSEADETYAVKIDSNPQLGNQDEFVTENAYYIQPNDNKEIGLEDASVLQFQVQEEYLYLNYNENQFEENTDEATGSENDLGSTDKSVHLSIESNDAQQQSNNQNPHRPGPAPSGSHICENCGKSFKYECRLRNHQKQELNLKELKCPTKGCNSAFNLPNRLREHLKGTHIKPNDDIESLISIQSGSAKKPKK